MIDQRTLDKYKREAKGMGRETVSRRRSKRGPCIGPWKKTGR